MRPDEGEKTSEEEEEEKEEEEEEETYERRGHPRRGAKGRRKLGCEEAGVRGSWGARKLGYDFREAPMVLQLLGGVGQRRGLGPEGFRD